MHCPRRSFLRAAGLATGALLLGGPSALASPAADVSVATKPSGPPRKQGQERLGRPGAAPGLALQFLDAQAAGQPERDLLARVRLFGDMHFGFTTRARLDAVATDLASLPPPDALLTTGDDTHFGKPAEYDAGAAWLANWKAPFFTVTGNHTFWSDSILHDESSDRLYGRFVERWGLPMPYAWELAGVRFVCAGPTSAGLTAAEASLLPDQVAEVVDLINTAPHQPTVLVLHSPLHHTVLGDGGPPDSVYTSDDPGFFQDCTTGLIAALAKLPQVFLLVTGHTHSPLRAENLVTTIMAGPRAFGQFNAMALPFVHRVVPDDRHPTQDLVTWELGVARDRIVLRGRDHLARRDIARTSVPLPTPLPAKRETL